MFTIPETLEGLDLDALTDLETQAVVAFNETRDDPDLDGDGLRRLRELAGFVRDVRARQAELTAAAEQVGAELDDLDTLVNGPADDGDNDTNGGDDGDAATDDEPDDEPAPAAGDPAPVPDAVTASVRRAARRGRKPVLAAHSAAVVRASADVPDVPHNHQFSSLTELAAAFDTRFAAFPSGPGSPPTRIKLGVAKIEMPAPGEGLVVNNTNDGWDIVEHAGSEARLTGGNLIAAANGWCAPNDRLWDLCPGLETTDGIVDFPTIQLNRGGLSVVQGLDFSTIYSSGGMWHKDEAAMIADSAKPCATVPCPTFADRRLELDGMCIKQDIVQNAIWPEVTRQYVQRLNIAHPHRINARLLAQMDAASIAHVVEAGGAAGVGTGTDLRGDHTTSGVLGALSIAATDYRYRYRMGRNATLEGVAPLWLLEWVRSDMARRQGMNWWDVSDEQINSWFARRKIRMQWVYDWQDAFGPTGSIAATGAFGAAAPPPAWPASVTVMLYAAGTWVKGTRNIIDLSAVYDSTGLEQNQYTAVFSEEAVLLIQRCFRSIKVALNLCPTGFTGGGVADVTRWGCLAA